MGSRSMGVDTSVVPEREGAVAAVLVVGAEAPGHGHRARLTGARHLAPNLVGVPQAARPSTAMIPTSTPPARAARGRFPLSLTDPPSARPRGRIRHYKGGFLLRLTPRMRPCRRGAARSRYSCSRPTPGSRG